MSSTWLTDREMAAWRSYIETYGDLSAALERDLAEHGLSIGDYQVLVYLSEADNDSMRMCDLADVLQLSPSGLTRRLDGLVSSDHVTRQPSSVDGRVMMAVLTDAGRKLLTRTAPHPRSECAPTYLRSPELGPSRCDGNDLRCDIRRSGGRRDVDQRRRLTRSPR